MAAHLINAIEEHETNEQQLKEWWDEDAARLERMAQIARAKGVTVKMPTKEEAEAKHVQNAAQHDMEELVINSTFPVENSNPEGFNQYTGKGGNGESETNLGLGLPPANDDPAPGGKFWYHGTNPKFLESIAKEGIKGDEFGGSVSVAPHLDSAHFWTGAAQAGSDTEPAQLRVKRTGYRNYNDPDDEYDEQEETAETTIRKVIKPDDVEIYHRGSWKPLKQYISQLTKNSNPEGINQYTNDGASGDKAPHDQIKSAIETVSTFGRSDEDLEGDRETAAKLIRLVSGQSKTELFKTLTDGGVEGVRASDSKEKLLQKLGNRITAAVRARERSRA